MSGGGAHPKDEELFAPDQLDALRRAAADLGYLRGRGYALDSALKLVGDRYQLRERQRTAIARATSEHAGAAGRARRKVAPGAPPPLRLDVDGLNVVITCETALHGGVLVATVDGGLRDLAGVHGTYRLGDATGAALDLVAAALERRGWRAAPVRWLLDAPVSNSGRLAARLRDHAAAGRLPWAVEVVPDPDAVLCATAGEPGVVVASGDAAVLDRCGPWIDLAAEAIRAAVQDAWIVDLGLTC